MKTRSADDAAAFMHATGKKKKRMVPSTTFELQPADQRTKPVTRRPRAGIVSGDYIFQHRGEGKSPGFERDFISLLTYIMPPSFYIGSHPDPPQRRARFRGFGFGLGFA